MADWERLRDYLIAEMTRHGWSSQAELADAAGVSPRAIWSLLSGSPKRLPYKIGKIEAAVGWEPGTARRIVHEGYRFPTPTAGGPPEKDLDPELREMRDDMVRMGLSTQAADRQTQLIRAERKAVAADPDGFERRVTAAYDTAPTEKSRVQLGEMLTELRAERHRRGCLCDRIGDNPTCPQHGHAPGTYPITGT